MQPSHQQQAGAQKLSFGQKFTKLLTKLTSSKTAAKSQQAASQKTIKIKGQLFAEHTDKICFDVKHKAHIVDIRDADFNESQKLLTESFDEYFQLIYQTVPAKFTPFSKVLDAITLDQQQQIVEQPVVGVQCLEQTMRENVTVKTTSAADFPL